MSIAKIIAPLTGASRDRTTLDTALAVAKLFNAHVVGLFVHGDPRLALPYMGAPISPDVIQSIVDSTAEMNRAAAKTARADLVKSAEAAGVAFLPEPKRVAGASCSFREMEGFFPQCVSQAARLSDLVVFGALTPADGPDLADAFVETLIKAERPVLLAPKAPASLTGRVAIAWDGSAIAARAVVSALPFFAKASEINVLSCHTSGSQSPAFDDIEEYFALHGLKCTRHIIEHGKHGVGEALLHAAKEKGCDLLVMGGFGHSHLSEAFFGGVTQHIRWNAELPVLMVH